MKTKQQIIIDAFRKLGMPGDGDVLTDAQTLAGINALNGLLSAFVAKHGLPLWKTTDVEWGFDNFVDGSATMGPGLTLSTTTIPMRVKGVWRVDYYDTDNPVVAPMELYERQKFNNLSTPLSSGTPHFVYQEAHKDYMVLRVWPTPNTHWNTYGSIKVTLLSQLDIDEDDELELDIPAYWEDAIIYGLATRLAPEYGLAMPERQALAQEAKMILDDAIDFDQEEGSLFLRPRKHGVH